MDIKAVVSEVLTLPYVIGTNLDDWDFESVFRLALDVAVVVMKKTSSASKEANSVLIASVVCDVIGQLKARAVSSADPKMSTEALQRWNNLETFASQALPVVLSHVPALNISRSFLDCFSFCKRVSSAIEVTDVKVEEVKGVKVEEKVAVEVAEVVA